MMLTGIEIRYLVNDIMEKIDGYYVSNIYGISRTSLLFKLHHPEKADILLMFSTLGFWISKIKIEQIEENRLVKRLRNDLLRSKVSSIKQLGAERIISITFSGFDKDYILIGEFFGDGNIILCDKDLKILALLHSVDVRHRKLDVGLNYSPPPSNALDIFQITINDFIVLMSISTPVVRWIGRNLGIPSKFAEEIVRKAKLDQMQAGSSLLKQDIENLFKITKDLVEKIIKGNHDPIIITNESNTEVLPIKVGNLDNFKVEKVSSFMAGLDSLFSQNLLESGKSSQGSTVCQKIEEFEHKLEEQIKAISTVKDKAGNISSLANLLLELVARGHGSIENQNVLERMKSQNATLVKIKGQSYVDINGEKIKINLNSPLQSISSLLFDESKRKLHAIKEIENAKRETEHNLERFRKQEIIAKNSVVFSIQKKKEWFERYRWFLTSDGLLSIGGRDASSNSSMIRKHLEKDDKVFHAEIFGSPFFILKKSLESNINSILETAQATVCFSRAWREGLFGLTSYWINPDQLKTAAPSGQFVAKGSFIIEGKRNFVKVDGMLLAIGLWEKNENCSLMCGPPGPIRKNCTCYVIIEPSGFEMVEIAKKIKLEFLKFKDKEKIVKEIPIDDFIRVLPAGESHIVESSIGRKSL